jgi:hypothetical protein
MLTVLVILCAGWMRPQNDGCALRAATLLEYANLLIENGQMDYVTANLWNNNPSVAGINYDLDYIRQHWSDGECRTLSRDAWRHCSACTVHVAFAALVFVVFDGGGG